jgi:hypothetical protein
MFAIGGQVKTAYADEILRVAVADPSSQELYEDEGDGCFVAASSSAISPGGEVTAAVDEVVPICVIIDEDVDTVNAQASDGQFLTAICSDQSGDNEYFEGADGGAYEDECEDLDGKSSDDITVYCEEGPDSDCIYSVTLGAGDVLTDADGGIIFLYECPDEAAEVEIKLDHDGDVFEFTIFCHAEPDTVTVTASPTKVEIIPQIGSVAHSEITIVVSGDGLPVDADDTEIDISVPKCAIEIGGDDPDSSPLSDNWDADSGADVSYPSSGPNADKTVFDDIWFHADWNNCTPGDVVVTVVVEVEGGADIVRNVTINVVGPPVTITATASPDKLICGEKSEIKVTVKDGAGQNVSNNTQVELISNWGSVIAGTGATLGFPGTGPVNPLASSAAATYNGVALAYLLTSNNHVGAYEVVAAAGGTTGLWGVPGDEYPSWWGDDEYYWDDDEGFDEPHTWYNALYTSAPITTQVTVTCSLPAAPAPTVTAPSTGTGSITPPNTGDAGLASSSSNGMLFVIVGAAAFVLAGIASVSYARR